MNGIKMYGTVAENNGGEKMYGELYKSALKRAAVTRDYMLRAAGTVEERHAYGQYRGQVLLIADVFGMPEGIVAKTLDDMAARRDKEA